MSRAKDLLWDLEMEDYGYDIVRYPNGLKRTLDTEDERDWNRLHNHLSYIYPIVKKIINKETLSDNEIKYLDDDKNGFKADLRSYMLYEKYFKCHSYPYVYENFFYLMDLFIKHMIDKLEKENEITRLEIELNEYKLKQLEVEEKILKLKGEDI